MTNITEEAEEEIGKILLNITLSKVCLSVSQSSPRVEIDKTSSFVCCQSVRPCQFIIYSSCCVPVVLQSMYCVGGEFSMPASNVVTVRFAQSSHLTFQIDPEYPQSQPQVSTSLGLLSRQQNQQFLDSLKCFVLSLPGGRPENGANYRFCPGQISTDGD